MYTPKSTIYVGKENLELHMCEHTRAVKVLKSILLSQRNVPDCRLLLQPQTFSSQVLTIFVSACNTSRHQCIQEDQMSIPPSKPSTASFVNCSSWEQNHKISATSSRFKTSHSQMQSVSRIRRLICGYKYTKKQKILKTNSHGQLYLSIDPLVDNSRRSC